MNCSPNLILYACIAKDTTILAEFNSKHSDLTDLAKKCLEKTPAFHSVYSHTVHGKTYMFFINDPFVYFGIFDESLEKHKCLLFLKNVKDVFTNKLSSGTMCFQGEFSSVIRQLVASKSGLSSKDGCWYVWNKQVMVVLFMDLVVCVGLFTIWLWVCDGFQCVRR